MVNFLLKLKIKLIQWLIGSISLKKYYMGLGSKNNNKLYDQIRPIEIAGSDEWADMLKKMKEEVIGRSCPEIFFLQNETIKRVFNPNQQFLAKKYLEKILNRNIDYYKDMLFDDNFGGVERAYCFLNSTPITIQHVHHILRIEEGFNIQIMKLNYILEYGAGYGNLAKIVLKNSYEGLYNIYDLDLPSEFQKFYLERTLGSDKAKLINHYNECTLGEIDINKSGSLFIATWSLSESPIEIRKKIECILEGFEYIYITFQKSWHSIDNQIYFNELSRGLTGYKTEVVECDIFKENYYLFASRK
jgi:hypothetical protein